VSAPETSPSPKRGLGPHRRKAPGPAWLPQTANKGLPRLWELDCWILQDQKSYGRPTRARPTVGSVTLTTNGQRLPGVLF